MKYGDSTVMSVWRERGGAPIAPPARDMNLANMLYELAPGRYVARLRGPLGGETQATFSVGDGGMLALVRIDRAP